MCSVPRGIPRYISFPSSVCPRFLRPVRGTLVPRFLPSVFLHESLPCRFPCRRVLPFSRAFLHDLLSSVHSEVVPVFSQFPSQTLYRYDQYCFHNSTFFASDVVGHVILLCSVLGGILISRCSNDFFRRLRCSVRATSVSACLILK